jgi:polysaccharide pyruvyl transferase WcaK-like protein
MKVLFSNAYSRANVGDGWLVDLSRDAIQEAFTSNGVIYSYEICCLDPDGFGRHAFPAFRHVFGWRLPRLLKFANAAFRADVIVGVGGGYLRSSSGKDCLQLLYVHLWQLAIGALLGKPIILLPQSIGPFPKWFEPLPRSIISRSRAVFARDDHSNSLVSSWMRNVYRCNDLAVVEVSRSTESICAPGLNWVFSPRRPGHSRGQQLELVIPLLHRAHVIAFQSSTGGSNDDFAFISAFGIDPVPLNSIGSADVSGAVCGRLHGALGCIRRGIPAIHLGYERKSRATYEALGLGQWCPDVTSISHTELSELVEELVRDPRDFWTAIRTSRSDCEADRSAVVEILRQHMSGETLTSSEPKLGTSESHA